MSRGLGDVYKRQVSESPGELLKSADTWAIPHIIPPGDMASMYLKAELRNCLFKVLQVILMCNNGLKPHWGRAIGHCADISFCFK